MKDNTRVIVRVRPLLQFEDEPAWISTGTTISCMHSKAVRSKLNKSNHPLKDSEFHNYSFEFDRVVEAGISSEKIYKSEIRGLIEKAIGLGRNCTIVAYGQTCSGKTYTLLGFKEAPGLIPCIFRDLFHYHSANREHCTFKISYMQIYNQKLVDLLNIKENNLKIIKDGEWGIDVAGSTKKQVASFEDCLQVLDAGESSRKYGEKVNHDRSSRSHTILRIHGEKWDSNMGCTRSVINVVDLAGSQRLDTNLENASLETGHINKSLFQFSNVISKLSQNNGQFIPYRDSKLTRLLEPSLTKNSNLAIIFCISPAVLNLGESLSTLRLAVKTKKVQIQNTPVSTPGSREIQQLKEVVANQEQQISKLKQKIEELEHQLKSSHTRRQKQNISVKAYVLLDHENFMLSLNDSITDIREESIRNIKVKFMDSLSTLYEQYVQQLVKFGVGQGYDEGWLRMEDITFCNLHYDQESTIKYKIPVLKQAYSQLCQTEPQLSEMIKSYIEKLEQKLDASYKHPMFKSGPRSPAHLTESPISEQASGDANDSTLIRQGSHLISWGCKKDNRVFKGEGPNIVGFQAPPNFTDIACGAHHSLAVNESGQVFGWGKNDHKQIVNVKSGTVEIPKMISIKSVIKSVAAGWGHSLLLSSDGKIYSFGYGEDGQLGHGNSKSLSDPTLIPMDNIVDSIYAGHSHSGFIDRDNNYYAFGFNKDYRLMIPDSKQVYSPVKVGFKGVVKAALGISHTCLLTKSGTIYCGGVGTSGQLGVDLSPVIAGCETILVPQKSHQQCPIQKVCPIVQVQYFENRRIVDISCGECSTGVITEKGELYTFGKSSFDRLGHSQRGIHKILENVSKVQMGYRHGFAWNDKTQQVYGWGFNMYNQLGCLQAKDLKTPQLVHELSSRRIVKISSGFFHSAALAK